MFYQPAIQDSRGNKVGLMSGLDSHSLKEMLSDDERKAFNQVMKEDFFGEKKKRYPKASLAISILGLGVIIFFISPIAFNVIRSGGPSTLAICIGVGYGFVYFIILGVRTRMRMKSMNADRPYARKMLSFLRCPGCLYSLVELHAESDGCTVCPECGGAWKLA